METPQKPGLFDTWLTEKLKIQYPIILAPMFLVSNTKMIIASIEAGITGAIPALNFRTGDAMRQGMDEIRNATSGPFGINLIVNKSNYKLKEQLQICKDYKVDFIITSLGNPGPIIEACQPQGTLVFCDVTDLKYALKVKEQGADALIAVNSEAGGHAGNIPAKELIPMLVNECGLPVISAGGVGTGAGFRDVLKAGACGISMGSPFIATTECEVSDDYKDAIVNYGAEDIVMTTKLSGTPCTVINTPYVQSIGTKQNWLEALLNKNRTLKKWAKMLTYYKGMKLLEKSAFNATYKSVWCAGPSIEHVNAIKPVKEIVDSLVAEALKNKD